MLALTLDLLAGRYVATAYNDRDAVEWPPHPARLFSALVATWAEGEPESAEGADELDALRWLEEQDAPDILASAECAERSPVKVYVPVNDASIVGEPDRQKLDDARAALARSTDARATAKAEKLVEKFERKLLDDTEKLVAPPLKTGKGDAARAARLLPDRRTRQERTFPSATPALPRIGFVWTGIDAPPTVTASLTRLLRRLVRLGHSSTLIRAALASSEQVAELAGVTRRYVPDEERGTLVIRWVAAGQTARLQRAFEQHRETEPRVLPARFVRYADGVPATTRATPRSVFGENFIVFARVAGPRLPIISAVGLSRQFRRALMSHAEEPIAEMLSGHAADGSASGSAHLAIVPLPVTSGPHPDGALIGVALVLPRECTTEGRSAVMRAIGEFERVHFNADDDDGRDPIVALDLGRSGVLHLQRVSWGEDRRATLQSGTWTKPSRTWASATPVALDKNPGDLQHSDARKRASAFEEATATVIEAIRRIGLPTPAEVQVLRSCVVAGTAKPSQFPRFPIDEKRPQRVLVHVRLRFDEPTQGPILIGAGRYQGLGLCLPIINTARSVEDAQ